ncbi:mandelate racemase/muconate lactonizing enzyme family protein [Frigidibacter sp. MR17.14]|uniref:mandelate racemase/muconate lactonizing enzyme family protein n=1 Tax=Frigidibacter sp. MR17.14 TaxID=3126509 RepID=UPI003012F349
MKITGIDIYLGRSGKLKPVLCEVKTDEGLSGWGEAGVAYGRGANAAAGMLKDFAPDLIGRDPGRIELILSDLQDHSFWTKNGGTIVFAAISALEQALWDIKGKALGAPVHALLGGAVHDRVRCYANGWYEAAQTPDEFARATERPMRDGYTALKFYPLGQMVGVNMRHVTRRQLDRDRIDLAVARVRAVRDAIGPEVDLMLDLSGGVTPAEAIRLCDRFAPFDIYFIEEPTDPSDAAAMAEVARRSPVPIAAGERHYTRAGTRPLIEARAVDIVQPDPGNTGGILETRRIAAMAETWGMRVAPHVCGSDLITNVALQVAAVCPNFCIQELYPYFRHHAGWVDVTRDPAEPRVRDGWLDIPQGPGLGVEVDREAVAPWLWASCA